MPYSDDMFYVEGYDDNIYDYKNDSLLQDMKEIIARINVYSPNTEDIKNRICNIELLLHGDYDCDGRRTGVPCALSACDGYCWQHAGEACR